jgi:prepilin-type N-terminal cleavage/methylation domain-containing protein
MKGDRRGFTLIEIVAAILVSAVLAVMIVQIVSGYTWRSYQPLQAINENLALREAMDNISADYHNLLITNPTPLVTLQQRIANPDSVYYDTPVPVSAAYNRCIEFLNNTEDEESAHVDCNTNDLYLKVTLQITGTQHRLTALFTR